MRIYNDIQSLRTCLNQVNGVVGFVPTMGALHDGHASLISQAKLECDTVICSIFVNPIQFNNADDYERYPHSLDDDKKLLIDKGCDILFCPTKEVMYSKPPKVKFSFDTLDEVMEGSHRLGHFSGVGVIVTKLFNIIRPDKAYFGLKDLQQLRIIQQIVTDLSFPIEIVPVPIVREVGGLAMSSRNRRLSNEGRKQAATLNETLANIEVEILHGRSFDDIRTHYQLALESQGFDVDYLELVDAGTLEAVLNKSENNTVAICVAASIEGVRLIDNRIF